MVDMESSVVEHNLKVSRGLFSASQCVTSHSGSGNNWYADIRILV